MLPSAASIQNTFALAPSPDKRQRSIRDGSVREPPVSQAKRTAASAVGYQNAFALAPTDSLPAGSSKSGRRAASPSLAEGLHRWLVMLPSSFPLTAH